jgi:hypothetical protein
MCFTIHKDYKKPIIAEEDIKCYKLVAPAKYSGISYLLSHKMWETHFFSRYHQFLYEIGRTYEMEQDLWEEKEVYITTERKRYGFHSYTSPVSPMLHRDHDQEEIILMEFVIPQGSEFYYDPEREEYISNKIQCIRYIGPFETMWLITQQSFINFFNLLFKQRKHDPTTLQTQLA